VQAESEPILYLFGGVAIEQRDIFIDGVDVGSTSSNLCNPVLARYEFGNDGDRRAKLRLNRMIQHNSEADLTACFDLVDGFTVFVDGCEAERKEARG
jgi:hypothetical protein